LIYNFKIKDHILISQTDKKWKEEISNKVLTRADPTVSHKTNSSFILIDNQ